MDTAIVTGAETPLGLRIVQSLTQQGYRVHGIGNNFSQVTYADPQFQAHAIDLSDLDTVASTLGKILEEEGRLHLLVHAIDVTPGNAFDKLPVGNLEAILKIGLLGPVMMTRLALPNLLRFRGQLIHVLTANKHGHPASAANALVEGGLREMNRAFFDQGRDAGLRITNCVLRQNTGLADGSVSDEVLAQSHINLDDVARTIEQLIDPKAVNVPQEIVLHPRLSASAEEAQPEVPLPVDQYSTFVLPPKEYAPPAEEKIPTEKRQQVERTIPFTDEEMEDKIAAAIEDFEAHPERFEQPAPPRDRQPQPQSQREAGQEGGGKNKRRRRRGGRNRNKKPQPNGPQDSGNEDAPAKGQAEPAKPDRNKRAKQAEPKPDKRAPDKTLKKAAPDKATQKAGQKALTTEDKKTGPAPKKGKPETPPAKKATKKAAKQAAKKATKKAAKKKTARKAAKKAARKTVRKSEPQDKGPPVAATR